MLFSFRGGYGEGSRTNLFLIWRKMLITPGLDGPVLPGIMRALVLELAPDLGLTPIESAIGVSRAELMKADEVFLTNSVRGVVPVGWLAGRALAAPGVWTARLRDRALEWLHQGG